MSATNKPKAFKITTVHKEKRTCPRCLRYSDFTEQAIEDPDLISSFTALPVIRYWFRAYVCDQCLNEQKSENQLSL
jgi:hypothetical protein